MPGVIPNPLWVFRIVHVDNIEFILTRGMFTKDHAERDPNYVNIADLRIQKRREAQPVRIPDRGNLSDYVPFYFGERSPMLFKIATGHGVVQRSQREIAYVCCKLDVLRTVCRQVIFSDGHASKKISRHFEDFSLLSEVDWDAVKARLWNDIDEDNDRERRKQAELLVRSHVPASCVGAIVVFDEATKTKVATIMRKLNLHIPVKVNTNFYYKL